MADNRQFGGDKKRQFGDQMRQFGEKARQFGDTPEGELPGDSQHCGECEAMLADALDGMLSAEDQAMFDRHAANCEPCGEMIADARRGAAWLELLRNPAPEPPADLLERILAQTSWSQIHGEAGGAFPAAMRHAGIAPVPFAPGMATRSANVIAFPRQTFAAVRRSGFGQIVFQPRLAMTAAMAFFSIALTMNLIGVHPTSLRLSDLEPSSLRRDFFYANARAVQYYEGLRVVYELESRVRDLQSAQDMQNESPTGSEVMPAGDSTPDQPAAPIPNAAPAEQQPGAKQHEHGKTVNPRTSRREDPMEPRRMVVAEMLPPERHSVDRHARMDRRLA